MVLNLALLYLVIPAQIHALWFCFDSRSFSQGTFTEQFVEFPINQQQDDVVEVDQEVKNSEKAKKISSKKSKKTGSKKVKKTRSKKVKKIKRSNSQKHDDTVEMTKRKSRKDKKREKELYDELMVLRDLESKQDEKSDTDETLSILNDLLLKRDEQQREDINNAMPTMRDLNSLRGLF